MQQIARMFQEGGIWMYIVLLLSLLHAVPVMVQMGLCKKVDFSGYLWGGLVGILLVGWIGTIVGAIQMFEALSMAMPDQRGALMARGLSIAFNPTLFAMIMVVPGLFFSGIASTMARNLAPRRHRPMPGKEG